MSSHLLGMSFDAAASPSIHLRRSDDDREAAGWGFAWYPMDDAAATVLKDPKGTHETPLARVLRDWDRFRSCVFVCHTHGAAKRITQQDTPPFQRSHAGRDFVFAHSGDLGRDLGETLPLTNPSIEPVGRTDSEHAFCWLLGRMVEVGARSLADVGWAKLHGWLGELNERGTGSFLISDGHDVVAYCDRTGAHPLWRVRRTPPHRRMVLKSEKIVLDLDNPHDVNREMAIVSGTRLSEVESWKRMAPGAMVAMRRGVFIWSSVEDEDVRPAPEAAAEAAPALGMLWTETSVGSVPAPTAEGARGEARQATEAQREQSRFRAAPTPRARSTRDEAAEVRREGRVLTVDHETIYRYEEPVELSAHLYRLHPVHDLRQDVLDYQLEISPPGAARRAEDVFGNEVLSFKIERPYTELWVRARSRVRVRPPDPLAPLKRATIPLVWMPWQRQMMTPYLLPPELPETQLHALSEYAMGFVERNDFDLIETLKDLNLSIYRDYQYRPGSTLLETSPFTVFVRREGVCQDFANLFICLCRLLGVPARYRVGYIFTGADYDNQIQSEASHAWAEVYLPRIGWRGFDPTNGVMANLDHVRVAAGRNYRDATPTSGTLFRGGKGETLEAKVKVEVEEEAPKDGRVR